MPSKHHSMVFYSSTLEVALCKKNLFKRHLYNGRYTQLTCMSEVCQALRYDCQFAFYCLQTTYFYQPKKTSVSPLSKKSISHENLSIKDISYQQQVFPLQVFHNIRFSSHFFVTFESIEYFNYYNMMTSPILTL